jgi:hypothetical protein
VVRRQGQKAVFSGSKRDFHSPESPHVYAPGFSFAAYLRSPYFSTLGERNQLDLPEMVTELVPVLDQARVALKDHFRARAAERVKDLVEEWKAEDVYPYKEGPQDQVERVQRQVFDVVAVQVAKALPDLQESEQKSRRFQLRMLRQAIERGPGGASANVIRRRARS